jgi:hypothetical protein
VTAEYVPTADQRALVENAAAFGITQAAIAEQLKIDEKTLRTSRSASLWAGGENWVGQDEDVMRDAAIHMHFGEASSIGLYIDQDRREHARNPGRRDKHLAKDFKSVWTVTCGYCAEIPHDAALCIQIRRHNDEPAAAPVLFSDTFKHAIIDEPRNEAPQRLRPEQ